jgi:hypothetical protein
MAALSHEDCAGWASRTEFTPDIVEALKRASFLLVVLSPNWMASKWCRKELEAFAKYHGPRMGFANALSLSVSDTLILTGGLPQSIRQSQS